MLYDAVGGGSADNTAVKQSSMNHGTAGTIAGGPTKKVRETFCLHHVGQSMSMFLSLQRCDVRL